MVGVTLNLADGQLGLKFLVIQKSYNTNLVVQIQSSSNYPMDEALLRKNNFSQQIVLHLIKDELYYFQNDQIVYLGVGSDIKYFLKKVVNFFKGKQICLERNKEVLRFMKIMRYFKLDGILSILFNDIVQNQNQYDIFTLFSLSVQFKLEDLYKQCVDEFVTFKFEHLNFNRYDLLHSQKHIFEQIIKLHRQYTYKKISKGISEKKIKKIIHEYEQYNSLWIDVDFLLKIHLDEIKQEDQNQLQDQKEIQQNSNEKKLVNSYTFSLAQKETNYQSQNCEPKEQEFFNINGDFSKSIGKMQIFRST